MAAIGNYWENTKSMVCDEETNVLLSIKWALTVAGPGRNPYKGKCIIVLRKDANLASVEFHLQIWLSIKTSWLSLWVGFSIDTLQQGE